MKAIIFLGPTLPLDAALSILPEAEFLPPARHTDVLSAIGTYSPDVIGLIDGAFRESLSVWHKELLFALHQGIRVFGAASIGALRAVELGPFGMLGVGDVFERFRTGQLTDDDEVAVVHTAADDGYRLLSEPLVNIRATLHRAAEQGCMSASDVERIVRAAKGLHFAQRTVHSILAAAGLSDSATANAYEVFRTGYVDVKADDARRLLETIRDLPDAPAPMVPMVRSPGFEAQYDEERTVRHSGIDLPLRSIAAHAAINEPDFDDLNFAALNRTLALVLADQLQLNVSNEAVEAEEERFCRQRGLTDPQQLDRWLRSNDLTSAELRQVVRELAICRRLHRWLVGDQRTSHQTRWLLDELRLRGRYPEVAAAAAMDRTSGSSEASIAEVPDDILTDLVPAHQRATSWRLHAPIAEWAEEAGFRDLKDLAYELLRARQAREHSVRRQGGQNAEPLT